MWVVVKSELNVIDKEDSFEADFKVIDIFKGFKGRHIAERWAAKKQSEEGSDDITFSVHNARQVRKLEAW